jgi:transcriptional regulator with PAS, ATPase and Fis domain
MDTFNTADLVGQSASMVRLRSYIYKVAATDSNVLITGETGTGKECVAESIHRAGRRASQPLVCINCAAIPDSLLESELFGYERGAFTGAQASFAGKLRLAHRGTVFLDEIGEMSPLAQAKLLRVVESREVFPLGANRATAIDVRFIAATNQELEPMVANNGFRKDLFYRFNVARLTLPPLRERKEDIACLFAHFLNHYNTHYGAAVQNPTAELSESLIKYPWPGNVRELRNLVEAIFIDPPCGAIALSDLPDGFRNIFAGYTNTPSDERERLLAVLAATHWNKSQAAAQLHWSRMTLYRKLAKYHLQDQVG